MARPTKEKQLTPKEKKAIEGIIAGETKRKSIMQAYACKSPEVADVIGQRVFKRERVIAKLQEYKEAEIDLVPKAIETLKAILDAPVKDVEASYDTKRKAAEGILLRNMDKGKGEKAPAIQFIDKYLNLQEMGGNRPKMRGNEGK